jgi:putative transposase
MYLGKDRKLNRWLGHDYSMPGSYFVTICTKERVECLCNIKNGAVVLTELGKIVKKTWLDLPNHYKNIVLDDFVIMPNHIHGIIEINNDGRFKTAHNVGNGLKPFPTIHGLSEIVRGFKTFSSRRINEFQHFQWQKSFHDRVIRNDDEYYHYKYYIQQNPINWSKDKNNPKNFKNITIFGNQGNETHYSKRRFKSNKIIWKILNS